MYSTYGEDYFSINCYNKFIYDIKYAPCYPEMQKTTVPGGTAAYLQIVVINCAKEKEQLSETGHRQ